MNSKVGRLIEEYDLSDMDGRLIDSWTGKNEERHSLRELADQFNRELLRAAMAAAGTSSLDGEVANTYRLLTAEDVSTGVRTQAESSLERDGIDPEALRGDFVSHQAIHTYLTKDRGVERPAEPATHDRVERAESTIRRLTSRLVAVAEKRLRSLRDAGTITLGTVSVLVDVRVVCEDCGTHTDVHTLLEERGCECDSDARS
ncbi:hypothetical protein BRC86_00400 [Halobacteriales archaeon QS_3_64_16]|nr:MAG: hypothetical protein BRC86_00400 [Halobacteriales archaeon QS_3_64_16]